MANEYLFVVSEIVLRIDLNTL